MATWNWNERVDSLMDALHATKGMVVRKARRAPPVTKDELAEVHAALGFELDARFLEFFRVCHGLEVIWVDRYAPQSEDPIEHFLSAARESAFCGRINVPSLREIFLEGSSHLFLPDTVRAQERTVSCLGGWDEHTLRASLRPLDDYLGKPGEASYVLPALVASDRYPDPPVIVTSDHAASLADY